jgi:tetratricopeptide (TPR) repeat protein
MSPNGYPAIVPELTPQHRAYLSQIRGPLPFAKAKPAGTVRVFCLGESTAAMPEFSEYLERALRDWRPGLRWEVLNAGVVGIDSLGLERMFRRVQGCSPDMIVVYFGHNVAFPPAYISPAVYHAARILQRSQALRLMALWSRARSSRWTSPEEPVARWAGVLPRMALRCRDLGVRLVVCAPSGNLMYPPAIDGTVFQDKSATRSYGRALSLLESGRLREAEKTLQALAARHPHIAIFRYRLGSLHRRSGDWRAARVELEKARDLDGNPVRCSSRAVRVMRSLARQHGFVLADVERAFSRAAARGITDFRLFTDSCHPRDAGLRIIAGEVVRALSSGGPP